MVRWVVGSILHGRPIELKARAYTPAMQRYCVLSCLSRLGGKGGRSWCDGSSDRSFMVDPLTEGQSVHTGRAEVLNVVS